MIIKGRLRLSQIISCDPEIMGGAIVFSGTRVPVRSLLDHLKAGDSILDFLDGFPSVSREQVEAFLELAFQAASMNPEYARAA